jgi:integral membrane protein
VNWSLQAYRIVAWVVGTGLVILVCVGVPLRYLGHHPIVVDIVGPLHGFLFIGYLILALNLAVRYRWNPVVALLVMGAGTVPFCSFIAEHYVTRWVRRHEQERSGLAPAAT